MLDKQEPACVIISYIVMVSINPEADRKSNVMNIMSMLDWLTM